MKVKFGMIVTDGSGKLGGQVMSSNRGGKYIRTKVTPSNPQTVAQQNVRAIFSSLSTAWAGLTEAQRLSWNGAVADYSTTDIFGDLKNPSGFNLFMKLNGNLATIGVAPLSVAPSKDEVPYTLLGSAVADVSSTTFILTFAGAEYDTTPVFITATPPLSAGKSNVKSEFRGIGYSNSTLGDLDIWALYVAKFGVPPVGANITVGVEPIIATGQKGTRQTLKATVQA